MLFGINSFPLTTLADGLNSPSFYSVETNNEYEVTTNISPTWENHANVQMTFTNTGSDVIHNWAFTFNMPYDIIDIWGGTIGHIDCNKISFRVESIIPSLYFMEN